LKKEFNNQFDVIDVSTGDSYQGIDGIGIIVNNIYIENIQQIKDIIEEHKILKVNFVFIQAKTSETFESAEMLNLSNSVKDFFAEEQQLILTKEVKDKIELKQFIFENYALMTDGEPICNLYFATLGKSINTVIENIRKKIEAEIKDLDFFSDVNFNLFGANSLKKLYLKISEDTSTTFSFSSTPVSLPDIVDIEEAYWGLVKFKEFRKLIINDEEDKIKSVFEDNVRDYQGNTPVNIKIENTLKNIDRNIFPILNNGLTIVADEKISSKGGLQFTIKNYQIVNGCQSSYSLFNNREIDGINDVEIPIKLVFTDNENIKNKIIVATNSQTKIEDEQLLALLNFQKNLEDYYKTQASIETLYYERRNGQYNTEKIQKIRIISKSDQLKAISAMFLHLPHLASGYKGKLFKQVKDKLFSEYDKFSPYYVSSLCLYKLERTIRTGYIDKSFYKARFHILMLFKLIVCGENKPLMNSKEIDCKSKEILNIVKEDDLFTTYINNKAIPIIQKSQINIEEKGALYTDANTNKLIETYKNLEKK